MPAGRGRGLPDRTFDLLCILGVAAFFVASLGVPLIDHDSLIYVLGGEGIVRWGRLPYNYVFDHKPVLIYFIYAALVPFKGSGCEFQVFSLGLLIALAALVWWRFARAVSFAVVLLLIVAAATMTVGFSGNSELVSVVLVVAVVGLLAERPKSATIAAAGALGAVALLTNYANAITIGIPAACCLLTSKDGVGAILARSAAFAATIVITSLAVLACLSLAGMNLTTYFAMQRAFLNGYAGVPIVWEIGYTTKLLFFSGLAVWALAFRASVARTLTSLDLALASMAVGGLAFALLSAKPWPHYLFFIAAPCAVLVARTALDDGSGRLLVRTICVALALLGGYRVIETATQPRYDLAVFKAPYAVLAREVGTKPVMSMRASVVPLYYSGALPAQPIVWDDQPAIMFGDRQDDYFLTHLARRPAFVMTGPGWCDNRAGETSRACASVMRDYVRVIRFAGYHARPEAAVSVGYDLYRRRGR